MEKQNNKNNYNVYARKSSEAEDRQVLSIGSQIDENKKIADRNGIEVNNDGVLSESASAKEAYSRPVFEKLLKDIGQGKVQGIIAWHPNRLSRNAIDTARLIDLFDRGNLIEVITSQQIFKNTPSDKFVFTLLCSQAKMENDNKSIDVKRGLRKKCEMGFPTSLAKLGYLNDCGKKGERRWLPDPDRFSFVKKMFEEYIAGNYSVRKLLKYANNVLGLKTVQRNKEGGRPLSLSQLYITLKDPFYAGFFFGKDENEQEKRYEVNKSIPRMITEEQHWIIQTMLGSKGKHCPSKYLDVFPYKIFSECGFCGGKVTAHHKFQLICPCCKNKFAYKNKDACPKCGIKVEDMETPKYLHYIYYNCIKKPTPECRKAVEELIIDKSIAESLEGKLELSPALSEWCLKHFDEAGSDDKKDEIEIKASWQKEMDQKTREYNNLKRMATKGLIDDDEFLESKINLKEEIKKAETALNRLGPTTEEIFDRAEEIFKRTVGIGKIFRNGTFEEKTGALKEICSNLKFSGKKVEFHEQKEFSIIMSGLMEAKRKNEAFEPAKYEGNKGKTEPLDSVRPTLLRW